MDRARIIELGEQMQPFEPNMVIGLWRPSMKPFTVAELRWLLQAGEDVIRLRGALAPERYDELLEWGEVELQPPAGDPAA